MRDRLTRNLLGLYGEAGAAWLEELPTLVAKLEGRWSLTALAPFENLSYNFVAAVRRPDGAGVILKIGVPNPELTTEIEALQLYDGRGCVKLLQVDRSRGALLLERLWPGTPLLQLCDENDEKATRIAAGVMRRLWRAAPPAADPFPTVARWAAGLGRMRHHFDGGTGPLPPALVEKAEALFAELLASMDEPVLLHGDLHHENILRSERDGWLAIDPKGVVGERAFEAGALLRNPLPWLLDQGDPGRVTARRVDILAEELNLDRGRLLAWALTGAVLSAWWCIEDKCDCWQEAIRCAEIIDRG